MKKLGIYVHIPFCKQKCNYCDFYSIKWDDESENKYIEAVISEINSYKDKLCDNYIVDSLFFGGGTPTIIKPENLGRIVTSLRSVIEIDKYSEISMEANPNTLTTEKLNKYLNIGINRLSIGIQSINDEILKKIGRFIIAQKLLKQLTEQKKQALKT